MPSSAPTTLPQSPSHNSPLSPDLTRVELLARLLTRQAAILTRLRTSSSGVITRPLSTPTLSMQLSVDSPPDRSSTMMPILMDPSSARFKREALRSSPSWASHPLPLQPMPPATTSTTSGTALSATLTPAWVSSQTETSMECPRVSCTRSLAGSHQAVTGKSSMVLQSTTSPARRWTRRAPSSSRSAGWLSDSDQGVKP